ncbi:MAG: hypothetical protein Q4B96_07740, partial [Bacillota bacterium]|nr:hypothetical protein [Bacillota bacterium]
EEIVSVSALVMLQVSITALLGVSLIAMGVAGMCVGRVNVLLRILACAAGLCMVIPGAVTDLIGLAMMILILLTQRHKYGEWNFLKGTVPARRDGTHEVYGYKGDRV